MHYIEIIKRVIPFFLTFAGGLILTSFVISVFAFIAPSNKDVREVRFSKTETKVERPAKKYKKRHCRKYKKRYRNNSE